MTKERERQRSPTDVRDPTLGKEIEISSSGVRDEDYSVEEEIETERTTVKGQCSWEHYYNPCVPIRVVVI